MNLKMNFMRFRNLRTCLGPAEGIYHMIRTMALTALIGLLPASCGSDGEQPDELTDSIHVSTRMLPGAGAAINPNVSDNTFTVLFWHDITHLETPSAATWPAPYLAALAPQPVGFYEWGVFDTRYPYPDKTSYLYATGYAPGEALLPEGNYRKLSLSATVTELEKGRYDFMGCDVWGDVYKGSQGDPFAHDKNKLYFRHLASKLVFYATRDKNTMENKQYVRNVCVTRLYMSVDGGRTYTPMHTPDAFEWQALAAEDFTAAYTKAIDSARNEKGNQDVTSRPAAGYKAVSSTPFAGDDAAFMLQKHATDRVPVYGMTIDSCYVSNEIVDGKVKSSPDHPIRLKMDITAEMSFDPDFPMGDGTGSTTDDITYTHTWRGVELGAIYQVDEDGKQTEVPVHEFRPGMEYHIYITFYRKGVNLVAIELPWNVGGVHYITISGADPDAGKTGHGAKH